MLRKEIIQNAIDLAQELEKRGLGVEPAPNSAVAALVDASSIAFVTAAGAIIRPDVYTPNVDEIFDAAAVATRDAEGNVLRVPHDEAIEETAVPLGDTLKAHLSYARNTVRPAVQEYYERISTALAAMPTTVSYNPPIIKFDLPEPLINPILSAEVNGFADKPYFPINKTGTAPERTAEQVLELLSTGNNVLDGDLVVWANRKGVEFFSEVWNAVFRTEGQTTSASALMDKEDGGVDVALVCFLAGRRLIDDPLEGTESSLADWKSFCADIVDQAGLRLAHALQERSRDFNVKRVVISYCRDKIVVNAPVYQDFLANGGSDAIIFGADLSGKRPIFTNELLESASDYITAWQTQNNAMTVAAANRRYSDARYLLVQKAEELIEANFANYFPQPGGEGAQVTSFEHPAVQTALKEINKILEKEPEEFANLWKIATEVVAKGIFYYTDAYRLLSDINYISELNPGISAGEAAMLATIEYVVDYIVDTELVRVVV